MQSAASSAAQPAAAPPSSKRGARRGGTQQQQLKLQVRGLPPTITLQQFEEACGEYVSRLISIAFSLNSHCLIVTPCPACSWTAASGGASRAPTNATKSRRSAPRIFLQPDFACVDRRHSAAPGSRSSPTTRCMRSTRLPAPHAVTKTHPLTSFFVSRNSTATNSWTTKAAQQRPPCPPAP